MPLNPHRSLVAAAVAAVLLLSSRAFPGEAPPGPGLSGPETLRAAYAAPPAQWPAPWLDDGVAFVELAPQPPRAPASPAEQAKAELGARLFRDPILSVDGTLACASCHEEAHGFSVATPVARGHGGVPGRRNPPALFTVAGRPNLGWDGAGDSLPTRSLLPLTAADEMGNGGMAPVLARLAAHPSYADSFARLYGTEAVSARTLGDVLAAFQRGLDGPTRFDRFSAGDASALADQEILGLHLFRTKARCANCHFGPNLTDDRFHNLRISSFGEPAEDLGRFGATGIPDDAGRFRTASLRHVSASPPYMHNGLFPTLEGVINLYDRGGGEVWARNAREAARPLHAPAARLSPHIRPLGLTAREKAALAAFLRTL